jgi:transglutaminase-like putative cysteine protease
VVSGAFLLVLLGAQAVFAHQEPASADFGHATRQQLAVLLPDLALRAQSLRDAAGAGRLPAPGQPLGDLAARVRAADLLLVESDARTVRALEAGGATAALVLRQRSAEESYRNRMDAVLEALDAVQSSADERDAAALVAALDELLELLKPHLDAADRAALGMTLPYRPFALPPAEPAAAPAIVPAYADRSVPPPSEADREASPDAPLSAEILTRAADLHQDPVAIFEFVLNEVRTEFYYGAIKGAVGALRDRRANDVDKASLLVALMRASRIPARYVRGVIALPSMDALSWTGVSSTRRAADVLARAGIPFRAVRQGGSIAAFEIEHTWVEVYLPYANYRGVALDASGQAWIPLDASMSALEFSPGIDPLDAMGFDAESLVGEYLAAPRAVSPLEFLRERISTYLAAERPELSVDQVVSRLNPVRVAAGLLPSTLPYATVSVREERAAVPESLRHRVRFTARDGDLTTFDVTLPASEIIGRRVTVSYVPATVEDQIAVHTFLGLDNTPAYLVRLRPVLKVGGAMRAAGETPIQMGETHTLAIEVQTPRGALPVTNTLLAGGYYALAFALGDEEYQAPAERAPDDTEQRAAESLYRQAAEYLDRWSDTEDALGEILRVVNVRPALSAVMVGSVYNRTHLFGLPQAISWRGVFVDADLRISEPVPIGADDRRARELRRVSGLAGSVLESDILQQNLQADAVSAARVVQLAHAAGLPVEAIDASNVADRLPLLETAQSVRTDVADAVGQGWHVLIPRRDLTRHAWTGIGYIVVDPVTGAGGYFISGGLAGGSTTQTPEDWANQQLADELKSEYAEEPNLDPVAAASIRKVAITDGQSAIVNRPLEHDLAVWVRDVEGRPVVGAAVTFKVLAGGGSFSGAQAFEATTDALGLAKANPTLGKRTSEVPYYLLGYPGDTHPTRVGQNLITAEVQGSGGTIPLAAPFQLFAHPGPPHHLIRVLGEGNLAVAGTPAGTIRALVADEHDNPVSNASVTFTVLPASADAPLPDGARNMVVYPHDPPCANPAPVIGECGGVDRLTATSSVSGASVESILGNTLATDFHVSASTGTLAPVVFNLRSLGSAVDAQTAPELLLTRLDLVSDDGDLISAAKVGTAFARPLSVTLFLNEPDFVVEPTGLVPCGPVEPTPCYRTRQLLTHRTRAVDINRTGPAITFPAGADGLPVSAPKVNETATVRFTSAAGGGVMAPAIVSPPAQNPGQGVYASVLTVGPEPAINRVEVDATAAVWVPRVDLQSGGVFPELVTLQSGQRVVGFQAPGQPSVVGSLAGVTHEVFGVRARFPDHEVVVVGPSGGTTRDFALEYEIEPPGYRAARADVDLFEVTGQGQAEEEKWLGFIEGTNLTGSGAARVVQGAGLFNPAQRYRMQVVLNRGSDAEVESDPRDLSAYLAGAFGADFRSRANTVRERRRARTVDLRDRLLQHKDDLGAVIIGGLARAQSECGLSIATMGLSMIEQGSGSCFWRSDFDADPVGACAAFQPGVSDHDFELLVPGPFMGQAGCLAERLNDVAQTVELGEVSFFAVPKEEFQGGRLNILPPTAPGGSDPTGDLGLGRQTLLLKWLLEGEYVAGIPGLLTPDPGGPGGPAQTLPLETILERLRTTPIVAGDATGVPGLEGYEIAVRERFNFYKSRAHIRLTGDAARDPKSALFELQQKELRNVAKSAIRAAAGRLLATAAGNRLLFIPRDSYRIGGCRTGAANPSDPPPPAQFFSKRCDSFEEHVVSAAVRSLEDGLGIFTEAEVRYQLYNFFRLKAQPVCAAPGCRTQIVDERAAADFAGLAIAFINSAAAQTQLAWQQGLAGEEELIRALRLNNLNAAVAKTNQVKTSAARALDVRILNENREQSFAGVSLGLFRDLPLPEADYQLSLVGPDSETIVDVYRDSTGNPILDEGGSPQPIFSVTFPETGTHQATLFLDHQDRVRECDTSDNFSGFFVYRLDESTSEVPDLPAMPDPPLPLPSVPAECAQSPVARLKLTKLVNGQGDIKVAPLTPVEITNAVANTGPVPVTGIVVHDLLLDKTFGPFDLAPGGSRTFTAPFRPREAGRQLIGPSEVLGFVQGGGAATTWDSVAIDVVPGPCGAMVATFDEDPNPYLRDGDEPVEGVEIGQALSRVMEGGRLYRYYRVLSGGGVPIPSASVSLAVNGALLPPVFTNDAGEIAHDPDPDELEEGDPSAARGLELASSAIGQPAAYPYSVEFRSVNGSPAICAAPFSVQVRPREFKRSWKAGASIKAEATAAVGLQGEAGGGIGLSISEIADQTHTRTKLGITRSVNGKLGVRAGASTPRAKLLLPGVRAEVGAKIGVGAAGVLMSSDTHEFPYPPSSSQLGPTERLALGGLLLASVSSSASRSLPLVGRMNEFLVGQITGFDGFKTEEKVSLGLEASVGGEGGFIAGLAPFRRQGPTSSFGTLSYGLEGGVGGSASASAAASLTLKPQEEELVPGYQLTAAADLTGALGPGWGGVSPPPTGEEPRGVPGFKNKLKASLQGSISGAWGASLVLDATDLAPRSLSLSYEGVKGWGWRVAGGQYVSGSVGAGAPKRATSYVFTDPDAIHQAVDTISTISAAAAAVAPWALPTGTAPLLGTAALIAATGQLFNLLETYPAEYETTTESGAAIEVPFGLGLGAGAHVEASLSLKFDRSLEYVVEKGVYKGGHVFPLERYGPDGIPELEPAGADTAEHVQGPIDAAAQAASAVTTVVGLQPQPGPNTLQTPGSAILTFDGATVAVSRVAIVSFRYEPIPGPVAPALMRPEDTAGPADAPHYGIGGFHQLTPQDQAFSLPATLTIDYSDAEVAGVEERTLGLYMWSDTLLDWVRLGGEIDTVNNTVTAPIARFALYTLAPSMPAGSITFTSQSTTTPGQPPVTTVVYESAPIRLNDGFLVPDGSLFTVVSAVANATDPLPFGVISTPDADPLTDGIQVASMNGVIRFAAAYEAAAGLARVFVYSTRGTALGDQVIPFQ